GQLPALGAARLGCVGGAPRLAAECPGGLYLANRLVGRFARLVARGAGGAHAGAVAVVDGLLVLRIDVVAHLVAGEAERLGVGGFHDGVEAAPEDHPDGEADQQQRAKGVVRAGSLQEGEQPLERRRAYFRVFHGVVLGTPPRRARGWRQAISTRRAWC